MSDMTTGFAAIADSRIYYEIIGRGPALVLIHGFSGNCRMWDAQAAAWSEHFTVIRYDLRGHGQSALPDKIYSHAGDLEALLHYLHIERAFVVGISMGGLIATHFALTRPHWVAALVLISPALNGWEWTPEWKTLWFAILVCAKTRGIGAAKQLWSEHPLFANVRANPATAKHLEQMLESYSGWHWLNQDTQDAIEIPDMARLDHIVAPTLIVTGGDDFADFQIIADILQQNIPQARAVRPPGIGHLINIEAPQVLNDAVLEFLLPLAARQ